MSGGERQRDQESKSRLQLTLLARPRFPNSLCIQVGWCQTNADECHRKENARIRPSRAIRNPRQARVGEGFPETLLKGSCVESVGRYRRPRSTPGFGAPHRKRIHIIMRLIAGLVTFLATTCLSVVVNVDLICSKGLCDKKKPSHLDGPCVLRNISLVFKHGLHLGNLLFG